MTWPEKMGSNIVSIAGKLDDIISLLRKAASGKHPMPPRLLRLKEAAGYLSMSPWKLRGLIQRGEISIIRNGDGAACVWLLDVRDLDEWIGRTKVTL